MEFSETYKTSCALLKASQKTMAEVSGLGLSTLWAYRSGRMTPTIGAFGIIVQTIMRLAKDDEYKKAELKRLWRKYTDELIFGW